VTRFLVDSNVLLDIATADTIWGGWSQERIRHAIGNGMVFVNPIIYAEVSPAFTDAQALDKWLDPVFFRRSPIPYSAGWFAAQAFLKYRRAGGLRHSPLPDFFIGAHAQVAELTLITRDATRYRTYFPQVELITP